MACADECDFLPDTKLTEILAKAEAGDGQGLLRLRWCALFRGHIRDLRFWCLSEALLHVKDLDRRQRQPA
jgi:hypothetical protein